MKPLQIREAINENDIKEIAAIYSRNNKDFYITVYNCFGVFLRGTKRLNVFAPTDSCFSWYALNGKIKDFTKKQIVADIIATPTMQ